MSEEVWLGTASVGLALDGDNIVNLLLAKPVFAAQALDASPLEPAAEYLIIAQCVKYGIALGQIIIAPAGIGSQRGGLLARQQTRTFGVKALALQLVVHHIHQSAQQLGLLALQGLLSHGLHTVNQGMQVRRILQ